MMREYHKWFAGALGRDMEMLSFGHAGVPVLVFPTSLGKYFEYEDREMIATMGDRIGGGALQFYCVDSVDGESWYNKQAHPYWRVQRYLQYERYLLEDVLPLIHRKNPSQRLAVTGCSFGGYHALNFALRHPDIVTDVITMGGAFDIKQFMNGYYSDEVYFNNPPDFLPGLGDHEQLERMRRMNIILATGEHDQCWNENERMAGIMQAKSIPHQLAVWRDGTGHDWPWWQKMARVYFCA
jgi:esterase/lipase superfamily enzyme